MDPNSNDFIDKIIELESKFLEDYDEMNDFISFYKKIFKILNSYEIKVNEWKPSKFSTVASKELPITLNLLINSKEYLFFILNDNEISLENKEIDVFKTVFFERPSQIGLMIVWNDLKLSAIKLEKDILYISSEEIKKFTFKNLQPLEDLIKHEVKFRERFVRVLEIPLEDLKHKKVPDLEKDFGKNLRLAYQKYLTRGYRGLKRSIMREMILDDLEPMSALFSEFLAEELDLVEIDENIRKLKVYEEETYD